MGKGVFYSRFFRCVLAAAFLLCGMPKVSFSQDMILPPPGQMLAVSASSQPPVLKGIKVNMDNPFLLDFILDPGEGSTDQAVIKEESTRLVKYFLTALTMPEKDMWVNLSPYEHERIINDNFGLTEMGRDLLGQDYILKQMTASLIYPKNDLGKEFWDRVYKKAYEKFGVTDVPIDTFNKVWIVPQKAEVYEHDSAAFIVNARMKVMLESDYMALSVIPRPAEGRAEESQDISKQVLRELVISELEREVNEGKNFEGLRQIYNSMVLASWYKLKIKQGILNELYIDKVKVKGVNLNDPGAVEGIYQMYIDAFKKGVFNYISEDVDRYTGDVIPRKYFSGGFDSDIELEVVKPGASANFARRAVNGTKTLLLSVLLLASDPRKVTALETFRKDHIQYREPSTEGNARVHGVAELMKRALTQEGDINKALPPTTSLHLDALESLARKSFGDGRLTASQLDRLIYAIRRHDSGYAADLKNTSLLIAPFVGMETQGITTQADALKFIWASIGIASGLSEDEARSRADELYVYLTKNFEQLATQFFIGRIVGHGSTSMMFIMQDLLKQGMDVKSAFGWALLIGQHHMDYPLTLVAQLVMNGDPGREPDRQLQKKFLPLLMISSEKVELTARNKTGVPVEVAAKQADAELGKAHALSNKLRNKYIAFAANMAGIPLEDAGAFALGLYGLDRITAGQVAEISKKWGLIPSNMMSKEQALVTQMFPMTDENVEKEFEALFGALDSFIEEFGFSRETGAFANLRQIFQEMYDTAKRERNRVQEAMRQWLERPENKGFNQLVPDTVMMEYNISQLSARKGTGEDEEVLGYLIQLFGAVKNNFGSMNKLKELFATADESQVTKADAAEYGGIDLDSAQLEMQIKNDGGEIKFHFDPAQWQGRTIDGLMPVILKVTPANDLSAMFGLN